jgi:membrane-bound ClpP family serine protease
MRPPLRRTLARWAAFQVPGWIVAAALSFAAWELGWIEAWVAWTLVGVFVGKDVVMFPLVRASYEPMAATHGHVGDAGVADGAIDPDGWARIGPELWRARLAPGAPAIAAGEPLRVVAVDGLVVVVEPER